MISGLLQNPQVTRLKVTVPIFTGLQFGKFFWTLKNQKPAELAGFLKLYSYLLVIKTGFRIIFIAEQLIKHKAIRLFALAPEHH